MKPREERFAELLASAERMASGEVGHRIELSSERDELDALAHAINVVVGELSYKAAELARAKGEAERRAAELAEAHESLLAKDRLATLGQLAGGIAHQIRNPLAVILNATSLLEHKMPEDRHPHVVAAIGMIQEEVRHANTIVTALLDYARVRQPTRQLVSLVDVVDRVFSTTAVPKTVTVVRAEEPIPLVHVDADQLHDAVLNVVLNAIEAMPDGGKLVVELKQRGDWALLTVTDTGNGIPAELEARLFEPLHSTKPMGIGLGLVTARTFVEAHGGRIIAVPIAEGARFEIRLPLGKPEVTAPESVP